MKGIMDKGVIMTAVFRFCLLSLVIFMGAASDAKVRGDAKLHKEMLQALDVRLLKLKKDSPDQFKVEMELQKVFNASVANFCQFYRSKCDGSVCGMCAASCYSAFYAYRAKQAVKINEAKLEVSGRSKVQHPAQNGDQRSAKKNSEEKGSKFFESFALGVCGLSNSIWLSATKPANCQELILSEINSEVVSTFYSSDENEGDVCAQL